MATYVLCVMNFVVAPSIHIIWLAIFTGGLVILAWGCSILLHCLSIYHTKSPMHPVPHTLITGTLAGIAGAVAGLVQQEIGNVVGSLLGIILGSAVSSIISWLISRAPDLSMRLPDSRARRILAIGFMCFFIGLAVDASQLAVLAFFPAFP